MKNRLLLDAFQYVDDQYLDMVDEVLAARNSEKITNRIMGRRRIAAIIIAAVLMLALAFTVMAYTGIWDWIISIHRDPDTERRGEIAQDTAEKFTGEELIIDETALDLENGVFYYFYTQELQEKMREALVQVDGNGRITWLDLRLFFPYPQPENCPDKYIRHLRTKLEGGEEFDFFIVDQYLSEVVYPDRDAYNERVQDAARYALNYLYQEGYIEANAEDADLIYFEYFNAGCACVDVLMKNGDVYVLFLLPDGLEPAGFLLHPVEELAAMEHERFTALFDAVRNGTQEEYEDARQAAFENGEG